MQFLYNSLMLFLLVYSCASSQSSQKMPDMESIVESGTLGKCSVSIAGVYGWRDWQPIVESPGKDGGSPLYLKVDVRVDNSKGPAGHLNWETYVFDVATHKHYQVKLVDRTGVSKWDGRLGDSQVEHVELMTHNGPYLDVGSEIVLLFRFKDEKRQVLWLKSKKTQIERTD